MRMSIVIFDGVDEFDFVAPYEILCHAAAIDNRHDIELVTFEPVEQITAAHGLRVCPDNYYSGHCDLLVIPGGGWVNHAEQGIRTEIEKLTLLDAIRNAHTAGSTLAAICTGTMALAHAGLLDGRKAITHQGAVEDLRTFAGGNIVDARVVDDGDIITCGGVTSGIDLSLWLVERFWNQSIAKQVARYMEYERGNVFMTKNGHGNNPDHREG